MDDEDERDVPNFCFFVGRSSEIDNEGRTARFFDGPTCREGSETWAAMGAAACFDCAFVVAFLINVGASHTDGSCAGAGAGGRVLAGSSAARIEDAALALEAARSRASASACRRSM